MKIFSPILKGTTTVAQGTTNLSGSFTGSLFGTAATASYADNFTVGGTLTAQTINVQIITSSIEFNTGSTRNGALSTNTHQFTGSVLMSGSLTVGSSIMANNTISAYLGTISAGNTPATSGTTPVNAMLNLTNNRGIGMYFGGKYSGDYAQWIQVSDTGNLSVNYPLLLNPNGGNVGIGTSSPSARLHTEVAVESPATSAVALIAKTSNGANDIFRWFDGATQLGVFKNSGNVGMNTTSPSAQLHIYGKAGNTFTDGLKITRSEQANQYLVLNYEGGIINLVAVDSQFQGPQFRFMTSTDGSNASERVRFAKDGNVLINKTTASGYPLEVEVFSDGNLAYFTRQGANTKMFMGGTTAGATAFYIQSNTTNGVYLTAGGTSWTANSDIRLKNVISPIDSAVDKLTTLNPVIFSWKSDDTNKENIGLIAQDVKEVLPQVIDTNEDGFLGVRYLELVPVLVKAIQELKSENDTLKEILQRNNIQ